MTDREVVTRHIIILGFFLFWITLFRWPSLSSGVTGCISFPQIIGCVMGVARILADVPVGDRNGWTLFPSGVNGCAYPDNMRFECGWLHGLADVPVESWGPRTSVFGIGSTGIFFFFFYIYPLTKQLISACIFIAILDREYLWWCLTTTLWQKKKTSEISLLLNVFERHGLVIFVVRLTKHQLYLRNLIASIIATFYMVYRPSCFELLMSTASRI
jgi:hypothetical protein